MNWQLTTIILSAVAIGGLATWGVIYYLTYALRSQVLGRTVWCGRTDQNCVALTFDDGPAAETMDLLDILRKENVPATFFLIGQETEKYPEIARRIVLEKHGIGNHSYSHPIYLFCSARKIKRELRMAQQAIEQVTGVLPKLSRPPCGVRARAYFAETKALNLQTIQWDVTGFDWKKRTAKQIAAAVVRDARAGSIILLHDGDSEKKRDRRQTVEAVPLILEGLRAKNLRVVPLEQMLAATEESTKKDHKYFETQIKGA